MSFYICVDNKELKLQFFLDKYSRYINIQLIIELYRIILQNIPENLKTFFDTKRDSLAENMKLKEACLKLTIKI
jgi:hypothetical protein